MEPSIHINYTAVIVAVIANFFLGFLWYTPLFGKAWAKELGMDTGQKPSNFVFIRGMVLMIVGQLLMVWVFTHNIAVWNPVTWGIESHSEMTKIGMALDAAFFTWLGFYLPGDLSRFAWEKPSYKLLAINTTYNFLTLVVAACVIVYMG
ncbi:MAG: DUF1761 family protein [Bacteroidetes bacterium]|nr:DUF1761 family protein [Bacteroidota bacterium]